MRYIPPSCLFFVRFSFRFAYLNVLERGNQHADQKLPQLSIEIEKDPK